MVKSFIDNPQALEDSRLLVKGVIRRHFTFLHGPGEKPRRSDSSAYRHVNMMHFNSADVRPWVDVTDDAV